MTHPSLVPSGWPRCGHGPTAENPGGCPGVDVHGQAACLAHLPDADLDGYLASLTAGSSINHCGTSFTRTLLNRLLDALRDPTTGHSRLGTADFRFATFEGDTDFKSVTFEGDANFGSATFESDTEFDSATFKGHTDFESTTFKGASSFVSSVFEGHADFTSTAFEGGTGFLTATFKRVTVFASATFKGYAWFYETVFEGATGFSSASFEDDTDFGLAAFKATAWFESAAFKGDVAFTSVVFEGDANFELATFEGGARFDSATFRRVSGFGAAVFKGDVRFESAVFERSASLGPLACAGGVVLSGATFNAPVTLSLAASRLECRRTRWSSTAEVRLRYALVDFAHAVFEYPLTIAAEADAFALPGGDPVDEQHLADLPNAMVRIASLRGVDAAHLVLSDVDLSSCLFTGTVHLDQLRLEGACSFDETPRGWHGPRWLRRHPLWFTQRRALAEEHHWRAAQPNAVPGWKAPVIGVGQVGPAQLAPVYRALRKALEDGKNEPDAADFYYGECEMRRHDKTRPLSERALLRAYWALSGYGLRAGRAAGWLVATMVGTVTVMMLWGLPAHDPKPITTGRQFGHDITLITDSPDPINPAGPLDDRVTTKRFEKSLRVVINSVVFRSSEQGLTTFGTYTEMTSRIAEPVLLGLAILAIRNRVKR